MLKLEDYGVSSRLGFLPSQPPLSQLPDPYYKAWEDTVALIPTNDWVTARRQVFQMPLLSTDRLRTEAEWRRAYSILTTLSQIYIWARETPSDTLPWPLAMPLKEVSERLKITPCATFASFCLWNVVPIPGLAPTDPRAYSPDNLKIINSFTGTKDEEWFFVISASIEAVAGNVIRNLPAAIEAAQNFDQNATILFLQDLRECLIESCALIDRMSENCNPSIFFNVLRPFLAGSKGNASRGLPHGVYYESIHDPGEWHQYSGGSNAQSSFIQLSDIILGINQSISGSGSSSSSFHKVMRAYMPGQHRDFLEEIERVANIRPFVLSHPPGSYICQTYNEAVLALALLRQKHIAMASRYIIIPSRKQPRTRHLDGSKGTGGTDFTYFLKATRDRTLSHLYKYEENCQKQY